MKKISTNIKQPDLKKNMRMRRLSTLHWRNGAGKRDPFQKKNRLSYPRFSIII